MSFRGSNVGIGTTDPGYQLELQKAGGGFLSFKTTDTDIKNPDVLGVIQFAADDATADGLDIGAKIVATATDNFQSSDSNVDAPTRLDFYTQNNSTNDVFSTVGATLSLGGDDQRAVFRGDVGIGTTNPDQPLEINIEDSSAYANGANANALRLRNRATAVSDSYIGLELYAGNQVSGGTIPLSRIYCVKENNTSTVPNAIFKNIRNLFIFMLLNQLIVLPWHFKNEIFFFEV